MYARCDSNSYGRDRKMLGAIACFCDWKLATEGKNMCTLSKITYSCLTFVLRLTYADFRFGF